MGILLRRPFQQAEASGSGIEPDVSIYIRYGGERAGSGKCRRGKSVK